MCLRALGKDVDVQRAIGEQIGKFELRGHSDAATLPMVVDDVDVTGHRFLRGRVKPGDRSATGLRNHKRYAECERGRETRADRTCG